MFKKITLIGYVLLLAACSSTGEQIPREPQIMTRTDYVEINYKRQPQIKRARQSLPFIKNAYQKGLKEGDKLYLTVKLSELDKSFELLDVAVEDWVDDKIMGRIVSQIFVLQHYNKGDLINFSEDDVVDWTLVKQDGSKEGGYVRKFLQGCAAKRR